MAYAVEADLNLDQQRLIELTDNSSAPGVKDVGLIAQLETEAETIVNGVLGSMPGVPFTGTIPPIIKFVTACIWKYRLYRRREVMDCPKTVEDDYAFAMSLLQRILAGEIELVAATPNLNGVPEVESSDPRGWTPRDLVV